ncbi:MAG TPA: hypothetical protein VHN99_01115 [Deinococcales bacterium]|nr:hypothetical protein [Deinococcales bacterium]
MTREEARAAVLQAAAILETIPVENDDADKNIEVAYDYLFLAADNLSGEGSRQ